MMNELNLHILGSVFGICLLIILCFIIFRRKGVKQFNELKVQNNTNEILLNDLKHASSKQEHLLNQLSVEFAEKQLENEQVTKQLEHRIKLLQESLKIQKEALEVVQSQQPEDKLYSRALKLVKLGADVEEIIRECDIPRAEAEMLLAVHNKK